MKDALSPLLTRDRSSPRACPERIFDALFATLSFALWLAFVVLLYFSHPA
jgi:hypothetical protein